ncbi:MAG TPA: hypothetical protein VM690_05725 [Gaiellaceae bacterium]|nr:hypothetical protein [Gaiellaceae bacterium]
MSVLAPETRASLRSHRVREPAFPNLSMAAQFDANTGRGRFKLLPTEAGYVVHDPDAPLGATSRGSFAKLADALARADECSRDADARGEPNEPERHGWRHDWGNPKTWERWW